MATKMATEMTLRSTLPIQHNDISLIHSSFIGRASCNQFRNKFEQMKSEEKSEDVVVTN